MSDMEVDIGDLSLSRKIRLKHLIEQGLALENIIKSNESQEAINAIKTIVTKSDEMLLEGTVKDRAQHSTEVSMDAQILKMSHELVSKVLQTNVDYSEVMYQNAINRTVIGGEDHKWNEITKLAISCGRPAFAGSTMLGSIEIEIKDIPTSQKRQRRSKKSVAEVLEPESIEQLKRKDKGAQKVNIVHKQISHLFKENNLQPIPFYKLIIDPNNFMKSVENAFQVAFLVRDGLIAIENGDDNYPFVRVTTSGERKSGKETSQSICSLDYETCRQMIEYYNIKEPMLEGG